MNQVRIAKPEKPVKRTKVLDRILQRYDVTLREKNSIVSHAVTNRKCELDPLTFAVYEACLKAAYLGRALSDREALREAVTKSGAAFIDLTSGFEKHYRNIARRDGFVLPAPDEVPEEDREKVEMQASDDYKSCARILTEVGLYFALLD